jgi:hypothetical protein
MPRAKSWAPAKIEIELAKNANPGTTLPWNIHLITTYIKTTTPIMVKKKPIMLAICKGRVEKPTSILIACLSNLEKE